MPFTYLGLPLGTTKPNVNDFSPLMNKIERRLAGVSRFLSYHGRLLLVNSVFFCPAHLLYVQPEIASIGDQTNRCVQNVLFWSKGDINRRGTYLVAWESTCKSKEQDGIGIIDIKTQNNALLLKFLDKFYNKVDIP